MKYKKQNRSIRNQIISIIIKLILPLNILYLIAVFTSINTVQEQARISLLNVSNFYIQQLDNKISNLNYYFYNMEETNAAFIDLSGQRNDNDYILHKSMIAKEFSSYINTTSSADGFFYYASQISDFTLILPKLGEGVAQGELIAARESIQSWLLSQNLAELDNWNVITVADGQWLLRIYKRNGFYYGAVISLERLSREIDDVVEFSQVTTSFGVQAEESGSIQVRTRSSSIDFVIQLSIPQNDVIRSLSRMQMLGIISAVFYLILIPVLVVILNNDLIKPLNKIKSALLKMKAGESEYRIGEHNYAEEFVSINTSFNEMADRIKYLKIENYEKEIAKEKMELQNLQLQINPHFLLNSFNLVNSLVLIKDYEGVQRMALYLSEYFRYIFREERVMQPIHREVDLVKKYLEVSAMRYPEYFEVTYDVDVAIDNIEIPPLLLHNFVENVIMHVLRTGKIIHIVIKGYQEAGYTILEVIDDGEGMPSEICDQVNRGEALESADGQKHIGMMNSYQRIKRFLSDESYMRVSSGEDIGLRVVIGIKMEDKDETADS